MTVGDLCLFLAVPCISLKYVIVAVPDQTHLLFYICRSHSFDLAARRRTKLHVHYVCQIFGAFTADLHTPPKETRPIHRDIHKCIEFKVLS